MDMRPLAFVAETEVAAPLTAPPVGGSRVSPALLDRTEQVVIAGLWAALLWRALGPFFHHHNYFALMAPGGELPVLLFVLIRRPTAAISLAPKDWALAAVATFLPLAMQPAAHPFAAFTVAGPVAFAVGMLVQVGAKLSLRRSFGIAPANRGVKTDGLYRFVRHPMYAGYLAMHIGIFAVNPSWVNACLYGAAWAAQIRRLLAEEALLGADPDYARYLAQQRWRLIPGVF